MSRMISWISLILVIASVLLIGLALYHPGLPESPAKLKPVAPQSGSTRGGPQVDSTFPTPVAPQAMPALARKKVVSGSPTPSNSGPTAQTAITSAIETPAERQYTDNNEISELKPGVTQPEEAQKKRSETTKTPKPQDPEGIPETLLVLDGKVFRLGQVEVSRGARKSIGNVVPLLKERPGGVVLVEGHSDSHAALSDFAIAAEKNHKVSVQRAQAVARILEQQGIPVDRIVVRGYGDTRPAASNATLEGRSRNRRVEIKFIHSLDRQ